MDLAHTQLRHAQAQHIREASLDNVGGVAVAAVRRVWRSGGGVALEGGQGRGTLLEHELNQSTVAHPDQPSRAWGPGLVASTGKHAICTRSNPMLQQLLTLPFEVDRGAGDRPADGVLKRAGLAS